MLRGLAYSKRSLFLLRLLSLVSFSLLLLCSSCVFYVCMYARVRLLSLLYQITSAIHLDVFCTEPTLSILRDALC